MFPRSGVSDSTCAYSVTDEIYCGAELQSMCTVFLLGFDGMMCSLAGMVLILVCMVLSCLPLWWMNACSSRVLYLLSSSMQSDKKIGCDSSCGRRRPISIWPASTSMMWIRDLLVDTPSDELPPPTAVVRGGGVYIGIRASKTSLYFSHAHFLVACRWLGHPQQVGCLPPIYTVLHHFDHLVPSYRMRFFETRSSWL